MNIPDMPNYSVIFAFYGLLKFVYGFVTKQVDSDKFGAGRAGKRTKKRRKEFYGLILSQTVYG